MKLAIGFIISLTSLSCGAPSVRTKATETDPREEKKEEQEEGKKPTLRKVLEIPKDLQLRHYSDSANQSVPYDHKEQLEQLFELEKAGKKLNLIIGRGNKEIPNKKDLGGDNIVWVYGDLDGLSLVKDGTPHLFMNFDKEEHLKTIPEGLFSAIAFDHSVAHFFRNISNSAREFHRLLKPDGQLFADLAFTMAIVLPGRGTSLEEKCQKISGGSIYKTNNNISYCLSNWDTLIWRSHEPFSDDDYKEIAHERREVIKNYLESFFGENTCLLQSSGAPVPENKNEFFVCTKK